MSEVNRIVVMTGSSLLELLAMASGIGEMIQSGAISDEHAAQMIGAMVDAEAGREQATP